MKKHNFSAGPAVLPQKTIDNCSTAVKELDGLHLSLLEISHRSNDFEAIMQKARSLVRELLEVPDNYAVLFLQGGATQQFAQIPMNLMDTDEKAAYIDTGRWSTKAIRAAKCYGEVEVVASSKDQDYNYIPDSLDIPSDAAYAHITTNNTVNGTQWKEIPDTGEVPLIADMSSDIFSYPLDVSQFGAIYAGAQKNLGPAGATLVIIQEDLLGQVKRSVPKIFDYRAHIEKDSALNTPPVFAVYGCLQTLEWIKNEGGVREMEKRNARKAEKMYRAIDDSSLFTGTAQTEDRSEMNATYVMEKKELEEDFLNFAEENGIEGIKGHRSVGGFRASMYNALPMESVNALTDLMKDFERKHN